MNQFGAQKFSFKKLIMILMFIISVLVLDPYWIGIGRYEKILWAIYRISWFENWDLLVLIGICRYEKKLIGHTLLHKPFLIKWVKRGREGWRHLWIAPWKKSFCFLSRKNLILWTNSVKNRKKVQSSLRSLQDFLDYVPIDTYV